MKNAAMLTPRIAIYFIGNTPPRVAYNIALLYLVWLTDIHNIAIFHLVWLIILYNRAILHLVWLQLYTYINGVCLYSGNLHSRNTIGGVV